MYPDRWLFFVFVLFMIVVNKCQADAGVTNSTLNINKNEVADGTEISEEIDETDSWSIEQLQEGTHFAYLDEDYASCVQLFERTRKRQVFQLSVF